MALAPVVMGAGDLDTNRCLPKARDVRLWARDTNRCLPAAREVRLCVVGRPELFGWLPWPIVGCAAGLTVLAGGLTALAGSDGAPLVSVGGGPAASGPVTATGSAGF